MIPAGSPHQLLLLLQKDFLLGLDPTSQHIAGLRLWWCGLIFSRVLHWSFQRSFYRISKLVFVQTQSQVLPLTLDILKLADSLL